MYASLGRVCFRHRRVVLLSWLAVFVVGIVVGGGVFARLKDSNGRSSLPARLRRLYDRFGLHEAPSVVVAEEADAAARPKVPV
jgi:hypothetical protein